MSDLFSAQPAEPNGSTEAGATTTQVPSPYEDLLDGIKNERGERKYKTLADALVGLAHAQTYIPQLKQEIATKANELTDLRNSSVSQTEYQELVRKLTTQPDQPQVTTPKQIDEEGIAAIVERSLTNSQRKQQETANQKQVVEALKVKYGEKAGEMFYNKASEFGLSKDEINSLAGKSPQAVLNMFGVTGAAAQKPASTQPPASTVRTESFVETPTSFIGRETNTIPLGGGSQYQKQAFENSQKMVEELKAQGLTVYDLENPSTFFKYMK